MTNGEDDVAAGKDPIITPAGAAKKKETPKEKYKKNHHHGSDTTSRTSSFAPITAATTPAPPPRPPIRSGGASSSSSTTATSVEAELMALITSAARTTAAKKQKEAANSTVSKNKSDDDNEHLDQKANHDDGNKNDNGIEESLGSRSLPAVTNTIPGLGDKDQQFSLAAAAAADDDDPIASTVAADATAATAVSQPQYPPNFILNKSKLKKALSSQQKESSIRNHSSAHSSSSSTTSISSVTMLPLTPGSSSGAGFGLFVDNDSDDTDPLNGLQAHEEQKKLFLTAMTLDDHELQAVLGMDDDEVEGDSVKKSGATIHPKVEKTSMQEKIRKKSETKEKQISSKPRKSSPASKVTRSSSFGAITTRPMTKTMVATTPPTTTAYSTTTLSRLPLTMLELRLLFQQECPGLSLPPDDVLRQRYNVNYKSDKESDEVNEEATDFVSPLPSSKQKLHSLQYQQEPSRHNPRYGLNKSLQEMLTSDRWAKTPQDDRDPDDASSTLVSIASGAPPPPPLPAASSKWTDAVVPTTTVALESSMRSSTTTNTDITLSPYRAAMETARRKKARKTAKAIKKKESSNRHNSKQKKSIVESEMLLQTVAFPAVHEEGRKGTVLLGGHDDASKIEEDDVNFGEDDGGVVGVIDFSTMRVLAEVEKAADDNRNGYRQDKVVNTVQDKTSLSTKPQRTGTVPSSPVSPLRRRIQSLVVLTKKVQLTTDEEGASYSLRPPSKVRTVFPPRRSKSDTGFATNGDRKLDESLLSNTGSGGGTHSPTIDRRGRRSILGKAKKRLTSAIGHQLGKKGHNGQNSSWGKVGGGSFSEDDDKPLVGELTTTEEETKAATTSKPAKMNPTAQQLQNLPLQMDDDEPYVGDCVVQLDNFSSKRKTRVKTRRRSKSLPRGMPLANRAEANGEMVPRKSSNKKRSQAGRSQKQSTEDHRGRSPSYQSKRSHDPSQSDRMVHARPVARRSRSNGMRSDKKHSSFNSSASSSSLAPPQRPSSFPSINSNSKQVGGAIRHKREAMRAAHARQHEHEAGTDDNWRVNANNDRSRSNRQASTRHSRVTTIKTAGSAMVDPLENSARSLTGRSLRHSSSGRTSEDDDFDVYANQSLEDLWKKAKLNAPKPHSEDETPPTSPSSAQFDDSLEGSFTIRW